MKFEEVKELSSKYLFQNYGRIDLSFTHGEGCYLFDSQGRKYHDLVAGIAVNSIGYSHPDFVQAMQEQVSKLLHVSNLYYVEEQARLAEKIASITPDGLDRTLFVNSGAEANEGALKLAVRYTGRKKVMAALNGFHGRTAAALGATGQTKYQASFEPLISSAYEYYDYGDIESVKHMITKDVAALIVEPVQGEGGVRTASPEFFKSLRDICTDSGALMIVDEVQTGLGRTGKWYGIQNFDVTPDIITMAKALGGGTPIGAVTSTEEISKVMTPGTHGTTFGGNPLVTAAGCSVIDIMKKEKLVEHAREIGQRWMDDIMGIGSDKIVQVRGYGLMIGIEMDSNETASMVQAVCRENGVLVNVCHGNTVRLIPPLIINDSEKDTFTKILKESL
ncbi:MAG: aspartate aminotransferase family protein [Candidatus Methanomethylophilaceae archaeon]|nr:aspartate aminotransferase family protein [Candidatus Methanomethylophilaceae archaeon]